MTAPSYVTEAVRLDDLRPHPRNYRAHPDDQIEHLKASLVEHGVYRPVVIARDSTILAGHGLVEAARRLGYAEMPAVRLDIDPDDPRAIKLLIGDNEISHLVESDDRSLSELLREVGSVDLGALLGTGYDEMMLANLVMVTRPASEIADMDAAAEWVGLPEYEPSETTLRLTVTFADADDRTRFAELVGLALGEHTVSIRWPPPAERVDQTSVRFEG